MNFMAYLRGLAKGIAECFEVAKNSINPSLLGSDTPTCIS
jgi:hypothetical protein